MFVEGMGTGPHEGGSHPIVSNFVFVGPEKLRSALRLGALKASASCQLHLALRGLASLGGCGVLLGEPAFAAIYASLERSRVDGPASYEALVFLGTVLAPIWALLLCRLMYADSTLSSGVEVLARYGSRRSVLAVNRLLTVSFLNGALGAISAVLALVCASTGWAALGHGELISALWIMGLGSAVYGALAVAITDVARSHLSRWAFILLDFLLGGTSRWISFPFPRAHIHNLLGSANAIEFSQRGSCIFLCLLLLLAVGLTLARTDP